MINYQNKISILFTFVAILCFSNCVSVGNDIKDILNNKKELIVEFTEKSIIKGRDKNTIILNVYKENLVNSFYLDNENGKPHLIKDSLEFDKKEDSVLYTKGIVSLANRLLIKMDSLKIDGVESGFKEFGIDIKFYLKKGGALLYVSDRKHIKNVEWIKYVNQAVQYDDHWYYNSNK